MGSPRSCARRRTEGLVDELRLQIEPVLEIDFVPNMYKLMAPNPAYLDAHWNKVKAVMIESQDLDPLTKEIIAVAVSTVNSCDY